ncbi:MAG: glycosyltransferase family 4 protein [Hydrogenophilales bacterium]|nr:glycosyltransferase family 4 protein [Hydrogenophilales bacterium]
MLHLLIVSFVVSAITGWLVVRWQDVHAHLSGDRAVSSDHKIHKGIIPRIGGLVVITGWTTGMILAIYYEKFTLDTGLFWALCLTPVFVAGLFEDFTKSVSPVQRLVFSFITALMAINLLDANLVRVDVPIVDALFLSFPIIAIAFTVVAVGGIAHAINIVDGLNGLAAGVCFLAYAALGYVSFSVGDHYLLALSTIGIGSLMGFYIWNYPSGQLFCGDGGAYFLGCYIAILSVLLVARNPEVSAWFPLLLILYPIWETLFSAYRRRIHRGQKSTVADKLHLHTLLYKRLHCGSQPATRGARRSRRNSDVSVHLIMLAGSTVIPAVLFWNNTLWLLISAATFVLVYLSLYRTLVRFKLHYFVRQPAASVKKNCELPCMSVKTKLEESVNPSNAP